jgi:hypothetical protein
MASVSQALFELCPNAAWFLVDEDYAQLEWRSDNITKPTLAEVEAKIAELEQAEPDKRAKENRAKAYAAEADQLFFKAQRGEATMDEWNAKVAEIRARYPYGGE